MLTDTGIRRATPGERDYKMADAKGLFLLVTKAGGKLWRWKYRFDGHEKKMSFGQYPEVTWEKTLDHVARLVEKVLDRQIAAGLNERNIITPRGGEWSPVQVQRVLIAAR